MHHAFFLLLLVAASAFAQDAENGKRLFTRNGCYQCHGREAQGSSATGDQEGEQAGPEEQN